METDLTVRRLVVELRLTAPAKFHFQHGGVLRGLLSRALDAHDLPSGLVPFACESGHVAFQPGDRYRLGFTLIGDTADLEERLIAGLRRLGRRWPHGAPPTLGGNFTVEAATSLPPPPAWPSLQAGGRLTLRFLSPLRLHRPIHLQQRGGAYLDRSCFPAAHFLRRIWGRVWFLANGRFPHHEEEAAMPPLSERLATDARHLLWLDVPIVGREPDDPYTLGGSVGDVTLEGVDEQWLPWLALAAQAHVGKGTSYGFGRFAPEVPGLALDPFCPAVSYLSEIAARGRVEAALEVVRRNAEDAARERGTSGAFTLAGAPDPEELARELREGRYRPAPLSGWLLPEKDGDVRPLAVPTVRDRTVQRAACESLAPAIDTLLEDSSYAYRKGLSRAGAARAIERAYADGYRWVLDADIEAFFDEIDWDLLFAKLHALLPTEPLVPLIEDWVRAPVVFEGRRIDRSRGLPQGSPISPLLANLYLDELDESIGGDFRLVRYADDFVVLCRSVEEAERAREEVRQALAGLGLTLNEDKTAVRSLQSPFSYLGYLFCRSLVIDESANEGPAVPPELDPTSIPPNSWLAQVPFRRVEEIVAASRLAGGDGPEWVPLAAPTRVDSGRVLYVTSPDLQLHVRHESLVIEDSGDGTPLKVPIHDLSHVVVCGRARVTVALLSTMAAFGVPTYLCRADGELLATFGPHQPNWPLWMRQAEMAADAERVAAFARGLVEARLRTMAAIAVRFGWQGAEEAAREMRALAAQTRNKTVLASLRGCEGRGAALFFRCLGDSLPPAWRFTSRQRHPPPDPFNSLLSFGYTIIHHHVSTALVAAGLNPRIGLFHQPRGTHHALASDLMEELRFLVEAWAWEHASRRHEPVGFTTARGRCLMSHDLRGQVLDALESRLDTAFTPPRGERTTYRQFIARQASRFAAMARGELARYEPLELDR